MEFYYVISVGTLCVYLHENDSSEFEHIASLLFPLGIDTGSVTGDAVIAVATDTATARSVTGVATAAMTRGTEVVTAIDTTTTTTTTTRLADTRTRFVLLYKSGLHNKHWPAGPPAICSRRASSGQWHAIMTGPMGHKVFFCFFFSS